MKGLEICIDFVLLEFDFLTIDICCDDKLFNKVYENQDLSIVVLIIDYLLQIHTIHNEIIKRKSSDETLTIRILTQQN